MAWRVIWSRQARDDLREIVLFIAADNPAVAESFGIRLMRRTDLLANFPRIGRTVPEVGAEHIREIVLAPYRIIYEVRSDDGVIAIVRIWHGARGEPHITSPSEF